MNMALTFLRHYFIARHLEFNDRDELEQYQENRVRKLLENVLPKSEFYRNYLEKYNMHEWSRFPLIDKTIMMENFDTLNTVGIKKEEAFNVAIKSEEIRDFTPKINEITVGLSSGTSGNRGLFLVSDYERTAWAGSIIGKVLPSSLFFGRRHKIAFFLRANSNLYTTLNSVKISFKFFDLLNDIDSNINELDHFNPTILVAPPSMLRILAKAQKQHRLNIRPLKIVSVAEVLDPIDEEYIEGEFKKKVHQVYQCTEGFLGYTCTHGTMHLNEDAVVIQKEYIDRECGKFVPIITDFNRTTQPIIRYRLNDILTESIEPCKCGSFLTAIKSIEGRCDDVFYFKSEKDDKLIPVFPDFLRKAVITVSSDIEEYKVVQKELDIIEITVIGRNVEKIKHLIEDNIIELLRKLGCRPAKVIFSNHIDLEKGKKLRRVERQIKMDI